MGDSGGAGSDGTESDSDDDGGSFEFGNVGANQEPEGSERESDERASEDELSDAVDFSLDMGGADFGSEDGASDPTGTSPRHSPDGNTEPTTTAATQSSNTPDSAENAAPTTGSPTAPDSPDGEATDESSSASSDDGSDGAFYNIDPVDESEKAFNFAEKQSKAAYEFAYKEATQNPLTKLLRKYTSRQVRERLDQVFSRKMLGSVFIGMSATNIVMVSVDAYLRKNPTVPWWEPLLWMGIFGLSVFVFVWWERLARKATEAANQAAESATEAAESASKKAEAASEAASQAAETATETATGGDEVETTSKPTTLNGKGQTAGGYTGGKRAPARRRAPDRRPNKRFEQESTTQQRLSTYEGEAFEQVELDALPQQGGGFENAGVAEPESAEPGVTDRQRLAEDDD